MGFIDPHALHAATHVIVSLARPQDFGIEYKKKKGIFSTMIFSCINL